MHTQHRELKISRYDTLHAYDLQLLLFYFCCINDVAGLCCCYVDVSLFITFSGKA